ncbi:hypothetical protein A1359_06320 [Methylomonas lenta]|uniref:Uncharacterized protein n=1 Tax=Methylomonas lenta TaxID=980561 RepID=A0A177NJR5_9GAMM|nr:hypothetical protein [Methylomonas lenta]OAI17280.1 hypothetical protein A1359_06320 [Methylomonas lenta]
MVAYIRQFLVVLLVLLQFAAPLVHAHVDAIGRVNGLHLHEFETLHIKSDALFLAATDVASTPDSAIVELGSAINIQASDDNSPDYYLHKDILSLCQQTLLESINFSPQDLPLIVEPSHSFRLSRAPPL